MGYDYKKIRERRERLKMSQVELAKRAKITRPYLIGLEYGRSIPTATVLSKIANALNVREAYFFSDKMRATKK